MDLSLEEIQELLATIAEFDCAEVEVMVGDVHLLVRRDSVGSSPLRARPEPSSRAQSPPVQPEPVTTVVAEAPAQGGGPIPAGDALEEWLRKEAAGEASVVRSPMVGIAYRAKEPGAPPFVEVGAHVDAGDVVSLVEVMKLFHSVEAGHAGTVAAVLFEDATTVEYGQPLLIIEHGMLDAGGSSP